MRFTGFLRLFLGLLILPVIFSPRIVHAENPSTCNNCFESVRINDSAKLHSIERHFAQYRWTENQIRNLYYHFIWQARTRELDPLSKSKRHKGHRDEISYLKLLEDYQKQSSLHSNSIDRLLKRLQAPEPFYVCSEQNAYKACVKSRFSYFYDLLEQAQKQFDSIFENERVYREEVKSTAGNRNGFYPEDTLEKNEFHDDYYSRFEMDRESARFLEDQQVRKLFIILQRTLTERINRTSCCFAGTRESLSA